jgi:hypothetical protein
MKSFKTLGPGERTIDIYWKVFSAAHNTKAENVQHKGAAKAEYGRSNVGSIISRYFFIALILLTFALFSNCKIQP